VLDSQEGLLLRPCLLGFHQVAIDHGLDSVPTTVGPHDRSALLTRSLVASPRLQQPPGGRMSGTIGRLGHPFA